MTFLFLSGRRPPYASAASESRKEVNMPWAGKASDEKDHVMQNSAKHSEPAHRVSTLPQSGTCCVERACAAFHEAQDALVAATDGSDEIDSELLTRRDEAFGRVRGLAGRTKEAVRAKKRVLTLMRDWLSLDNPRVSAFAFEVATEAVALLGADPGQACSCGHTPGEAGLDQARSVGRRNPFSWFSRPWGHTKDMPFAN